MPPRQTTLKEGPSEARMVDLIHEHADAPTCAEFTQQYALKPHLKFVRDFIRDNALRIYKLEEMANLFGLELIYLPRYHFECNAIELIWRQLKNAFRRTDPALPWQQRLSRAYETVTPAYVDACISGTISWCLAKHAELRGAGRVQVADPAPGGPMVIDDADLAGGEGDDFGIDSDGDEDEFEWGEEEEEEDPIDDEEEDP